MADLSKDRQKVKKFVMGTEQENSQKHIQEKEVVSYHFCYNRLEKGKFTKVENRNFGI